MIHLFRKSNFRHNGKPEKEKANSQIIPFADMYIYDENNHIKHKVLEVLIRCWVDGKMVFIFFSATRLLGKWPSSQYECDHPSKTSALVVLGIGKKCTKEIGAEGKRKGRYSFSEHSANVSLVANVTVVQQVWDFFFCIGNQPFVTKSGHLALRILSIKQLSAISEYNLSTIQEFATQIVVSSFKCVTLIIIVQ